MNEIKIIELENIIKDILNNKNISEVGWKYEGLTIKDWSNGGKIIIVRAKTENDKGFMVGMICNKENEVEKLMSFYVSHEFFNHLLGLKILDIDDAIFHIDSLM